MRKLGLLAVLLAVSATPTFARGLVEELLIDPGQLTEIGSISTRATAGSLYSNITNGTGYFGKPTGASGTGTTRVTFMDMDDTTIPIDNSTPQLTSFSFTLCNGNASIVSTNNFGVMIRWFAQPGGIDTGPTTFLGGTNVTFGAANLAANTCYNSGAITLGSAVSISSTAVGSNWRLWTGQAFYTRAATGTISNTVINNMGYSIMNAPETGSSDNGLVSGTGLWTTNSNGGTSTTAFTSNNPSSVGFQYTGISSNINFELFPEPGTLALLGLGGLMLARRRR